MKRPIPFGVRLSWEKREGWWRLDWNENPYPPPKQVVEKMKEAVERINEYPPLDQAPLKALIGKELGIDPWRVSLFAGSAAAIPYALSGPMLGWTEPNFGYLERYARRRRMEMRTIPSAAPTMAGIHALIAHDCSTIYVSNPMAQIGLAYSAEQLLGVARKYQNVRFLVDEAYVDFSVDGNGHTVTVLNAPPLANVWVLRTFSKCASLAGARVGCLVAPTPEHAAAVEEEKDLEDVNVVAWVGLQAMLSWGGWKADVTRIIQTRDRILLELEALGAQPYASVASFVTFRSTDAGSLVGYLMSQRVLVRAVPGCEGLVRASIGTDEAMDAMLDGLREWARLRGEV